MKVVMPSRRTGKAAARLLAEAEAAVLVGAADTVPAILRKEANAIDIGLAHTAARDAAAGLAFLRHAPAHGMGRFEKLAEVRENLRAALEVADRVWAEMQSEPIRVARAP